MSWLGSLGSLGGYVVSSSGRGSVAAGRDVTVSSGSIASFGRNCSISINGKVYTGSRSVEQKGGKIYIDDVLLEETKGEEARVFNIVVTGPVEGPVTFGAGANVTINGSVTGDITSDGGDIKVAGTARNIKTTNGIVEAGEVKGSVTTMNGTVNCGEIGGDVSTMNGSINGSARKPRAPAQKETPKREPRSDRSLSPIKKKKSSSD